MKTITKLLFLMLLSMFLVVSCDDHQIDDPQLEQVVVKDLVLSSKVGSDLFFDVNANRTRQKSVAYDECLTVTHKWSEDHKSMTMSITYNNCVAGGITKNGEIRVSIAHDVAKTLMTSEIEFVNFTVNGSIMEGTMEIKAKSADEFEADYDLKLQYADGSSISWKGKQTVKILSDGTWEINGQTEGKARNGKLFTRKDINLIKTKECPWYVGGKMELTVDGSEKYDIEFTSKCGDVYYTYKGVRAKLKIDK